MKLLRPELILYAAYASLVYLIAFSAEVYLTVFQPGAWLETVYALEVLLSIVTYLGWMVVGMRFRNQLLLDISIVAVFLIPVAGILALLLFSMGLYTALYAIISSFSTGLVVTVFGISLLRMRKRFGDLARVTGWLDIILGICLLSIILAPVAVLLMPPVIILEAALLFKAYGKAGRSGLSRLLFWKV